MNTLLEDQVILVPGGRAGFGRTSTLALARAGASVVIADIDISGGRSAVEAIARAGGQVCFLATDVRDANQIRRIVDYVLWRYGLLDGAFNSAGQPQHGRRPLGAARVASQQAVLGLTRAAAREYADRNIRIHATSTQLVDDNVVRLFADTTPCIAMSALAMDGSLLAPGALT